MVLKRYLMMGTLCLAMALGLLPGDAAGLAAPRSAAPKLRLSWELLPGAVTYEVVLLGGGAADASRTLAQYRDIFTPGLEIDTRTLPQGALDRCWLARGFDRDGRLVGETAPRPLAEAEMSPTSPLVLDDYRRMAYMPVYPVYAWVPVLHASSYEIEVWRESDTPRKKAERVRHFYTYDAVLYDADAFLLTGHYWWRVRALDGEGRRYSDWSPPVRWEVTAPTPFAALGDSITHGGGAISTPPCRTMYDWETYCKAPVKNIGLSGDTAAAMADRFERDVLPFKPKVLVIMGGVNDFRAGTPAAAIIYSLRQIADKCRAYDIVPVFVTATPINADRMAATYEMEPAAGNWKTEQTQLNKWIMAQKYAVDVTAALIDAEGNLRADYTADGLHPDYQAKRYIGETIGRYLEQHFATLLGRKGEK